MNALYPLSYIAYRDSSQYMAPPTWPCLLSNILYSKNLDVLYLCKELNSPMDGSRDSRPLSNSSSRTRTYDIMINAKLRFELDLR
ncbi:MAG: hypothetical protein [Caudoviricetes sp.]|nr:MAG: hypothetical protein [Caudoviricetes sp.]